MRTAMLAANVITDALAYESIIIELYPADDFDCDDDSMTTLGMAVEACMLMDDAAQARYQAIYGRPWIPLCCQATEGHLDVGAEGTSTCAASPRGIAKGTR